MSAAVSSVVTSAPEAPTVALARVVEPLAERDALTLTEALGPLFEYLDSCRAEARLLRVDREDDVGKMKRARVLRLELKGHRVELDKKRKDLKADVLAKGKAIDAAFALFEGLVKPMESWLLEQETFAERALKARQDALRDARIEALRALGVSQGAMPALGELTEEAWAVVLEDARAAKETRERLAREAEEARVEAERILAERRAADAKAAKERAERERIAQVGRHRSDVLVALGVDPDTIGPGVATLSEDDWAAMRAQAQEVRDAREREAEAERAEARRQAEASAAEVRRAQADRDAALEAQRAAEATASEARRLDRFAAPTTKVDAEAPTEPAPANDDEPSDKDLILWMAGSIRRATLPEVKGEAARKLVDRTRAYLVKLAADIEKHAEALP